MQRRTLTTQVLAIALLTLSALTSVDGQTQARKRGLTAADLFDFVWIADPQLSPDGSQVVFYRVTVKPDRSGYEGSIYLVSTNGTDAPIQLIAGENVSYARWSPDGQSLVYRRDGQLNLFDLRRKQSRTLTSLPNGVGTPVWSPDGRRIAFRSATPDKDPSPIAATDLAGHKSDVNIITDAPQQPGGRHQHIWVIDVPSAGAEIGKPTQLTSGVLDDTEPVWSPDGSEIYFLNAKPDEQFTRKTLYSVSVAGGPPQKLTTVPMGIFHLAVSPDGKRIAFHGAVVTDPVRLYSQFDLWVMDLKPHATPRNLTADYDFDMNNSITGDNNASLQTGQTLHWSADGRWIYDIGPKEGRTRLLKVDTETKAVVEVTKGDQSVLDFSPTTDARKFVTVISNPVMMADLFVVDADGTQRRITDVNEKLWSQLEMTMPEEITFRSFDGRPIQGWIQKPPNFDPGRKYPLILQIHGGPNGSFGWTFNHEFQFLAARGYVVLYVNPRGSFGYGQEFGNLVQYHHPVDDSRDLMAAVDEVLKLGYIDPKKLGVAGGSAGGMVTDWIVGHTDRFAAAVSSRDIANWETWWYTTNFDWFTPVWFKNPPFEDRDDYVARSPITYVEKIHTPMMFILGDNDHVAPPNAGGGQMFRALKFLKRPAVMITFPREGHGLIEPWHRAERLQHIVSWFDQWILGIQHPEYGDLRRDPVAGQ